MALTTETARNSSPVITDVNANIPASVPTATPVLSPEAAILFDKSIVARPLMTPAIGDIHVKRTEYYYRWVAAKAQSGAVYTQRRSMGFTNATTDDVDILSGEVTATEGEIRAGDLILMKIQFPLWAAHVKANMVKAQMQQRMRGVYADRHQSTDVWADDPAPARASVANEPFSRKAAVPFIPENPDAIIDSQTPQAVAAAKHEMKEIRERHAHGTKE